MWHEILVGVLGNILTLFLIMLVVTFWHLSWRRALLKFFGVEKEKRFLIYLGKLPHSPGGLCSFWEMSEAKNLESLFRRLVPGLNGQPGFLSFLSTSEVDVEIKALSRDESTQATFIAPSVVVGSPMYTGAARKLQDELGCPVGVFPVDPENPGGEYRIRIPNLPDMPDTDKGLIVRYRKNGTSIFYVVGRTEFGTTGAFYHLIHYWKPLRRAFGDESSFCRLVRVSPTNYKESVVVSDGIMSIS